jgi:glucose/arabinose dehydrogenase
MYFGNFDTLTTDTAEDGAVLETDEKDASEFAHLEFAPAFVTFVDGTEATFDLAEPFHISVAAEGLGKARFMTLSPDGRLFVPDLVNMNLSHEGKIYILDDFDEETKKFKTKHTYLSGLRGPNSVAFYTDENGETWIYVALTAHLLRYPYTTGDMEPSGEPEIVAEFPNKQVAGEVSIVWHITRTIAFHNDRLYVSVGSGCNSCEQPEDEMRAMIYSIKPDGSDMRIYADGLRNAVGFIWADGELYATVNGVDHLGPDAPNDVLYGVEEGAHYGWPHCYEANGKMHQDTAREWKRTFSCDEVPLAFVAFEAHAAPLGLAYFSEDAHLAIRDSFLVALHGAFQRNVGAGYHIVRVSRSGEQEDFMDGFWVEKENDSGWLIPTANAHADRPEPSENGEPVARPMDILQRDANSFFVSDDYGGRIFYIYAE